MQVARSQHQTRMRASRPNAYNLTPCDVTDKLKPHDTSPSLRFPLKFDHCLGYG